jgi:hypothetical protein
MVAIGSLFCVLGPTSRPAAASSDQPMRGGDTEIGTWRPEGVATAPANHSGDGAADRKASSHIIATSIFSGRKDSS